MENSESASPVPPAWRYVVWASVFILPMGMAFGMLACYPWLAAEHMRLTSWEMALTWASEFVAAFWFLAWLVLFAARPSGDEVESFHRLESTRREEWNFAKPAGRPMLWFLVTMAIGLALDGMIVAKSFQDEFAGHAQSVPITGTVVKSTKLQWGGKDVYSFVVEYQDTQGNEYITRFRPKMKDVPNDIVAAMAANKLPTDIPLRIDPKAPRRVWLDEAEEPHHNRMANMSGAVLLFQVLLALLFFLLSQTEAKDWVPPVQTAPFAAVALIWTLVGVATLFGGREMM